MDPETNGQNYGKYEITVKKKKKTRMEWSERR
jgi:hypothetical protein